MQTIYDEQDLINFGKYILSTVRENNIKQFNSSNTNIELILNLVTSTDVWMWKALERNNNDAYKKEHQKLQVAVIYKGLTKEAIERRYYITICADHQHTDYIFIEVEEAKNYRGQKFHDIIKDQTYTNPHDDVESLISYNNITKTAIEAKEEQKLN